MNNIVKNRLLSILIIVLLLANLTTLGLYWLNKERKTPPPPNGQKGGNLFGFLTHELNFDSVQQTAYKKLIEESQSDNKDLQHENRIAKETFFQLLAKENVSDDELKKAATTAGEADQQMLLRTFDHFKKVRALCNTEQKKKFDSIIKQAIGMMGQGKQGPPPPRGEHGQHDGPPPPDDGQGPLPPSGERPPQ